MQNNSESVKDERGDWKYMMAEMHPDDVLEKDSEKNKLNENLWWQNAISYCTDNLESRNVLEIFGQKLQYPIKLEKISEEKSNNHAKDYSRKKAKVLQRRRKPVQEPC
jgi:hypothetical protein